MARTDDLNANVQVDNGGPSPDSFPIAPSNTAALPRPVRYIRATGAGNVVAITAADEERTLAFEAGETRFVVCKQVMLTGTTATGLEGMP